MTSKQYDKNEIDKKFYLFCLALLVSKRDKKIVENLILISNGETAILDLLDKYGGMTIKLPTKVELLELLDKLKIYYYVEFLHLDLNKVVEMTDKSQEVISDIVIEIKNKIDQNEFKSLCDLITL